MYRRILLALTMTLISATAHAAQFQKASEPGGNTQTLWDSDPPGADRVKVKEAIWERAPGASEHDRFAEHVTHPLMTLFEPRGRANGITLLIVPGGGYVRVVIDKEGFDSAEWFAARGFSVAVLRYRMPADGWGDGVDAPVHDAMRAIRLLRHRAAQRGQAEARIGVIGFSAGGHVAARLITDGAPPYARRDAIDDLSARPDFAVLMYPVIATVGAFAHGGSVQQLMEAGVTAADLPRYSPDRGVDGRTPPTLLVHAADDTVVPVDNSLLMFDALRKAGVRSELHVFDRGGHGFGLRGLAGMDAAAWPMLVESWATRSPAER